MNASYYPADGRLLNTELLGEFSLENAPAGPSTSDVFKLRVGQLARVMTLASPPALRVGLRSVPRSCWRAVTTLRYLVGVVLGDSPREPVTPVLARRIVTMVEDMMAIGKITDVVPPPPVRSGHSLPIGCLEPAIPGMRKSMGGPGVADVGPTSAVDLLFVAVDLRSSRTGHELSVPAILAYG